MTFLIIMLAGLIGLILMALPGMQHHGHVGTTPHIAPPAHGGLHLGHGPGAHTPGSLAASHTGHAMPQAGSHAAHPAPGGLKATPSQAPANGANTAGQNAEATAGFQIARLIPSPRAIFSIMTLFGAFGYALVTALHFAPLLAALIAIVPAWAIEYFAARPLWNLMFQFQGKPCSSIETLIMCEAKAVTPFRNGRGLVSLEHDGRLVQFSARLPEAQAGMPVRVGDTLRVEEVDAANQRVLVTLQ
jgi:hypothetical protein